MAVYRRHHQCSCLVPGRVHGRVGLHSGRLSAQLAGVEPLCVPSRRPVTIVDSCRGPSLLQQPALSYSGQLWLSVCLSVCMSVYGGDHAKQRQMATSGLPAPDSQQTKPRPTDEKKKTPFVHLTALFKVRSTVYFVFLFFQNFTD